MTDKELLVFAALAAKYKIVSTLNIPKNKEGGLIIQNKFGAHVAWNPRIDMGDALQLACDVGLSLEIDAIYIDDARVKVFWAGDLYVDYRRGNDPDDAVRFAILLASADIGQQLDDNFKLLAEQKSVNPLLFGDEIYKSPSISPKMRDKHVDLIKELVKHIERNTCEHLETYRAGSIWEICGTCGQKWADDRGGKPEFNWPICVENARKYLEEIKNE